MHEIIENYKIREHAILGPFHAQGPSGLIRISYPQPEREYSGAYQCCYLTRRELINQYPELFGPRYVNCF